MDRCVSITKRLTLREIIDDEWLSRCIDMPTTPLMTSNSLDNSGNFVEKALQVALDAYHKARTVTLMDVVTILHNKI